MAYRVAVVSQTSRVRDAMTSSGRCLAIMLALLTSAGCGGGLEGSLRSMAVAHRSEWRPDERFLECEPGEVRVEALPREPTRRSRWSYWAREMRLDRAVIDPDTGDVVSLLPDFPDYFVANCGRPEHCYWREVLIACEAQRCEVVADNSAEEGMVECFGY